MKDIAGKTAFVTGGASGIGLGTARALVARGARVLLADIDRDKLERAAAELEASGGEVETVAFNVADRDQWEGAAKVATSFGPVSILCSNAGVGGGSCPFEDYDPDVWEWIYAVNAHAHLYACRTFLGDMKTRGEESHLVITASMVGVIAAPVSSAYVSSKYATMGIAQSVRNELAGTKVGISVLCPGIAATNIVETTRVLRPNEKEVGDAVETAQKMDTVLAAGMSPDKIGERVARAIEQNEFYIFTHPEWKRLVEPQVEEMLAAFRDSADPDYAGDDIDALVAANGARGFRAVE